MCTLIALHSCVDRVGLIVAANRDEYFDRPSEGPALRNLESGPIVAPLDVRAGGTWFGVNRNRVFVALTNRPTEAPDASRRSRGHVVTDALAGQTAVGAAHILNSIPAGLHNPFNAFVSDGERAFTLVYDEKGQLAELEPGAHVVGNADPDDRSNAKIAHVLERAEAAAALPMDRAFDALGQACCEHDCGGAHGTLSDPCVHLEAYGTRSSFLMTLDPQGREADRLLYADGPPCETEHEDFTGLLSELTRSGSYGQDEFQARTAT